MAQRRIVLIEDNDDEIWLLRDCLECLAAKDEFIILKDGEAALRFIKEEREGIQPCPCVIVLDVHLPKYDGLEILAAIRCTPVLEHVAALVVSTITSPDTQRQIAEYGAGYMDKPNTLDGYQELAKRVQELCESKYDVAA